MNSIKFKIKSYDPVSDALVVCFCSDTTISQEPDDYTAYAFQPLKMWPDITDVAEIKKRLAMTGMHHAQMQETNERYSADPARVAELQNLVGQTHEYLVAELEVAKFQTPFRTV